MPISVPEPLLEISGLSAGYGKIGVLRGIDLTVGAGEVVTLLGPNGAGKTTIINMVLGVLRPDEGSIAIAGSDMARQRSRALAHANFAAVYAQLPGNLTVLQNLRIFGLLYGVSPLAERIEAVLEQFNLQRFRDTKCGLLSSGEQTRACLAKALLNHPRLLLLDEPTASLDPSAAQEIRGTLRQLATQGDHGVLWTSHNMNEVREVCDRVMFLSKGKVLLEGDPKTLPAAHGGGTLEELFIRIAREPLSPQWASRGAA